VRGGGPPPPPDAVTDAIDALEQVGATVLGTALAEGGPGGSARLRAAVAAVRQRHARLRASATPDPQGAGGSLS
jgi:hypothetical protein